MPRGWESYPSGRRREEGRPWWDEETCHAAAAEGHLVCLVLANETGCPGAAGYAVRSPPFLLRKGELTGPHYR